MPAILISQPPTAHRLPYLDQWRSLFLRRRRSLLNFHLTEETDGSAIAKVAQASVPLKQDKTWVFSDVPEEGICPSELMRSAAAAHRIEHGTMLWILNASFPWRNDTCLAQS